MRTKLSPRFSCKPNSQNNNTNRSYLYNPILQIKMKSQTSVSASIQRLSCAASQSSNVLANEHVFAYNASKWRIVTASIVSCMHLSTTIDCS